MAYQMNVGPPGSMPVDLVTTDDPGPGVRHRPSQRHDLEKRKACEPIQEQWESRPVMMHWVHCEVHVCGPARPESLPAAVSSSLSRLPGRPWRHIMRCGHEMLSLTSACSINCAEQARLNPLDSTPATCPICGTSDFTTFYWRLLLYIRSSLADGRRLVEVWRDNPHELNNRLGYLATRQDDFIKALHDTRLRSLWFIISHDSDIATACQRVIEYCNDVINGWMNPLRDVDPATGKRMPMNVRDVSHFYGVSPADEDGHVPYRWQTPIALGPDEAGEDNDPRDWVPYMSIPDFANLSVMGSSENVQSAGMSLEIASHADSSDSGATLTAPGFSHDTVHRTDNEHVVLLPTAHAVKILGRGEMLETRDALPKVLARVKEKARGTAGTVFQSLVRNVTHRQDRTGHFIRLILQPAIHEIINVEMPAQLLADEEELARWEARFEDRQEDRVRDVLEQWFLTLARMSTGYFGDFIDGHRIPWLRVDQEMHSLSELRSLRHRFPDFDNMPWHISLVFRFFYALNGRPLVFRIPGEQPVTGPVPFIRRMEELFGTRMPDWNVAQVRYWRDISMQNYPRLPPEVWGEWLG